MFSPSETESAVSGSDERRLLGRQGETFRIFLPEALVHRTAQVAFAKQNDKDEVCHERGPVLRRPRVPAASGAAPRSRGIQPVADAPHRGQRHARPGVGQFSAKMRNVAVHRAVESLGIGQTCIDQFAAGLDAPGPAQEVLEQAVLAWRQRQRAGRSRDPTRVGVENQRAHPDDPRP